MSKRLKQLLKRSVPDRLLSWWQVRKSKSMYRHYAGKSVEQVFSDIHANNAWRGAESLSGPGSDLARTQSVRTELPGLLAENGVRSMLDLPCGDFHWMRHVELGDCSYIGGDIVPQLIADNQAKYGGPGRQFLVLDLTADELPRTDLVLCRDCFIHLPNESIARAVENVRRSGATYLLTTTFPHKRHNIDGVLGGVRPINLTLKPFGFPPPLRLVMEDNFAKSEAVDDANFIRGLGLWRVADLPAGPIS